MGKGVATVGSLGRQGNRHNCSFCQTAMSLLHRGEDPICSDLQSKISKPAIKSVFQPTLSAADGLRNRHYLQLNLQSSPANRHYLQLKRRPETHLIVPNLDVVCWTELLDPTKPCQTLSGLRRVWPPTNVRFLHRSKPGFSVANNVGSNPSIAGSVADNSGLNAFQLHIIPVGKWR